MENIAKKLVGKYKLNSSRVHLEAFVRRAADSVPQGSRVLDAGAGDCRYAHLFGGKSYESADFGKVEKTYGRLTYECDLTSIPVESERYDLALLTQVLEHLPDPLAALKELHRILKPGHRLWLSQPLYYEEHEQPYDFYRYTQFGLRHLLLSAGFRVEEMFWLEGYVGTLAYQLELASRSLPMKPAHYGGGVAGVAAGAIAVLLRPALFALSQVYARLDARHRYTGSGHCKNYCVIALKPSVM
jgi:SAM-dependent methyltransferase